MSNNTPRNRAIQLALQLGEHAAKIPLTQEQVAEKCGFAQGTISRVFAGKYPAKSEILCAIAEAVGCEIQILNCSETGEKI
jgi:transcriptional regulator with XRE-family HTH domain